MAQHGKRSLNKQTSPDIAQVIVGYSRLYYERHGVKPTITRGKDGEIVKRMLSACGGDVAEVLGVIETGLDSQDPFLKDKGFSLSALWSNWQGLQLARKEKRTHGDREVRRGSRTHGPTDASKFGRGLVKG